MKTDSVYRHLEGSSGFHTIGADENEFVRVYLLPAVSCMRSKLTMNPQIFQHMGANITEKNNTCYCIVCAETSVQPDSTTQTLFPSRLIHGCASGLLSSTVVPT